MQMTADSRATTTEVIAMLQRAVHAAIQDYSVWSGGHILDGSGAERMMQVYAATRLFEVFNPRYGAVVHLEVPFSRLLGVTTNESLDLMLEICGGPLYAVKFKNYNNPAAASWDLIRLRNIVCNAGWVGLFVASCYQKGIKDDWPIRDKMVNEMRRPTETWHLSRARALRSVGNDDISHERALVIEVDDCPEL